MPQQESFKCRLCLGRGGNFTNIVNAKNDAEKVVREAIEELLELKVVRDRSNPWKLCYQCFKTLTDFNMFKRQCRENSLELERQRIKNQEKTKLCRGKVNRVQQITKRKEKVDVDNQEVEIPFCRGEVNHNIKDQDGTSLAENRKEEALNLSSVGIVGHKEECNADIPRKKELGKEVLKFQENHQKQDVAGKERADFLLHSCEICDKVFEQMDFLKPHMVDVHHKKGMQFICYVCSEVLECENDLVRHVKLVHAPVKSHKCKNCSRHFENMSELQNHMSMDCSNRQLIFAVCSKVFTQSENLEKHMLTHSGTKPFKCDICSKGYTLNGDLKRHKLTHTGERKQKCTICSKLFILNSHLKTHLLTHTAEKPHKCTICSKSFSLVCLKEHMMTHTNEKLYKCDICSKAFSTKKYIRQHMMTHTAKRKHKCTICSKGFAQKNVLKNHMSTHTAERPYKCSICLKTFTQKGNCYNHMLRHTGEKSFKCNMCPKAFTYKCYLEIHSLSHSDERPHKPVICLKTFNHKGNLSKHKKVHEELKTN